MAYPMKRHEVVQPQDQSIKLIPLTRGKNAIVDAADYDFLVQWNWYAYKSRDSFYAARFENVEKKRKMIFMHRVLTENQGKETDHQNRDTLDNRRRNIRPCTHGQNQGNRTKDKRNTSGYKGVSWSKTNDKWQAQTSVNGEHIHLGFYATPESAHAAYCEFALKHKGEFARF